MTTRSSFLARLLAERSLPFLLPAALAVAWMLSTAGGLVPAQVLPSPLVVAKTLGSLAANGDLWSNVSWSLRRVALGFGAGASLGILLGTAMALAPRVRDYLYPSFSVLIYIPILAWLPLLMLVLGLGEAFKIVLIAKAALVPMTLQSYNAVRDVPLQWIEMGRVNRLARIQILALIIMPAAFASIWSGLRYAHSRAWASLVIVELLASSEGLGFLIGEGQQLLQLDLLIAAILVLAAIAFSLDRLFAIPERWITRWRPEAFAKGAA